MDRTWVIRKDSMSHYATGLKFDSRNVPVLRASWAGGVPPTSPDKVDRLSGWGWNMGGNDRFGTCFENALGNQLDLTTYFLTGKESGVTDADCFDLYRRSGNPLFDPAKPPGSPGDDGTFPSAGFKAATNGGLHGSKLVAWADLADKSDASIQAAVNEFGAVMPCMSLQQKDFTYSRWVYDPTSPVVGGHAVMSGAYDRSAGNLSAITWAERREIDRTYLDYRVVAVYLPIWDALLSSSRFFSSGLDIPTLALHYRGLTGKDLPGLSYQFTLDLDKSWLTGLASGFTKGAYQQPFPVYVGVAGRKDFMVMADDHLVCVPEPYTLHIQDTGYRKIVIDTQYKNVYTPVGWQLSIGTGFYMVGRMRPENVVVISGTQRAALLPAQGPWWSAV